MSQATSPSAQHARLAQSYADEIVEMVPEPPETFRRQDICEQNEWFFEWFLAFQRQGLFERVDTAYDPDRKSQYNIYRVRPEVWDRASDVVATRDAPLPCGHGGLVNAGDHLECSFQGCDKQFDREEVVLR